MPFFKNLKFWYKKNINLKSTEIHKRLNLKEEKKLSTQFKNSQFHVESKRAEHYWESSSQSMGIQNATSTIYCLPKWDVQSRAWACLYPLSMQKAFNWILSHPHTRLSRFHFLEFSFVHIIYRNGPSSIHAALHEILFAVVEAWQWGIRDNLGMMSKDFKFVR
jgi:hypothetical protein